mmetsp:Transcript_62219/g.148448  ORF Transcript_62219/g.148448 Transcript_62219/m.148448 type:complete len:238 (+) Transcript_62219:653-1366(+)
MATAKRHLLETLLVNSVETLRIGVHQMPEARVHTKDWLIDLSLQVDTQVPGEQLQDGDVGFMRSLLRPVHNLVQAAPYAAHQLRRHAILTQIPSECSLLLIPIAVQAPESCHSLRDAGNERGESHHGEQQHKDGEEPLALISRKDLHRRRRELREAPVQGHAVSMLQALIFNVMSLHPRVVIGFQRPSAHPVPDTGNHVIENQDEDNQADDANHDHPELGLNPFHGLIQHSLQLHES